MSAAAFAKGLLDLEGQLTPILVGTQLGLSGCSHLICFTSRLWLSWVDSNAKQRGAVGLSCKQGLAYAGRP